MKFHLPRRFWCALWDFTTTTLIILPHEGLNCAQFVKGALFFLWPDSQNAKLSPFMSLTAFCLILIHAFQSGLSFLCWQSLPCCKQISELCWEMHWRMKRNKLFSTVDYSSQVLVLSLSLFIIRLFSYTISTAAALLNAVHLLLSAECWFTAGSYQNRYWTEDNSAASQDNDLLFFCLDWDL